MLTNDNSTSYNQNQTNIKLIASYEFLNADLEKGEIRKLNVYDIIPNSYGFRTIDSITCDSMKQVLRKANEVEDQFYLFDECEDTIIHSFLIDEYSANRLLSFV